MVSSDVVELGGARVALDASGIVVVTHAPQSVLDVAIARRILDSHRRFAAGRKLPVLVDARGVRRADREARELVAGPAVAAHTSRVALLVGGTVSAVIGNFFLRVSRPVYPTRVFSDIEEARAWLLAGAP